jgi:hypothetical protein
MPVSGAGIKAIELDIHVGLMVDLGQRIRYQAIVVGEPTRSFSPQLA